VALLASTHAFGQEPRLPVPDAESQKKAEVLIRDTYKDEYAKNQPSLKKALAKKLQEQARDRSNEAPLRFVLYRESNDLAQQAGDSAAALEIIDEWGRTFAIDGVTTKSVVLVGMSAKARSPEEFKPLTSTYLALVDDAIRAGNMEIAVKAAESAVSLAKKAKDMPLVSQSESRLKSLQELKGVYDKGKKAIEALEKQPNDAEANLSAGKFYCFFKGDWEKGSACLGKGSDPVLKGLVQKEAGNPSYEDAVKIGDGWWEAAEKEPSFRTLYRDRAVSWYLKSWPGVQGLSKEKARARLRAAAGVPATSKDGGAPAAWGTTVGVSLDVGFGHSGRSSIRLSPGPTPDTTLFTGLDSPRFPAKPGATYEISCWAFTDGNQGGTNCLFLRFWKANGEFISQVGPGTPFDMPVWTRVSQSVQCPVGVDKIDVSFQMWSKKGVIWIDEVSLRLDGKELLSNGSFEGAGK